MSVGGSRLINTCFKSTIQPILFRYFAGSEIGAISHSLCKRTASIRQIVGASTKNLHTPSLSHKTRPTILEKNDLHSASPILTEVAIRQQSGSNGMANHDCENRDVSPENFNIPHCVKSRIASQALESFLASSWKPVLLSKAKKQKSRVINLDQSSQKPKEEVVSPSMEKPRKKVEISSDFAFWLIMGLNVTVFAVWQIAVYKHKEGNPNLLVSMYENFTSSLLHLAQGRFWTLFTPCISHIDYAHIFLNMLTYFYFGRMISTLVGGRSFLIFYFLAGIASSTFSLFCEMQGFGNAAERKGIPKTTLGASGSVAAIVTAFSSVRPKATLLLYFVIPIPAWILIPGLFAYDLWGLFGQEPNKVWWNKDVVIDSAGHLGGFIAGRLYWIYKLRRFRLTW